MKARRATAVLAAALLAALANGVGAQQLGEAVRAVMDGRQQKVTVELSDGFAEYVQRVTNARSRVYADVSVVKTYAQPGCKRLRVMIRAPEALATDPNTGQQNSFVFDYEMDLCGDGDPPSRRQ